MTTTEPRRLTDLPAGEGAVFGWATQHDFAFRFAWGSDGLASLIEGCRVVVVVDVLRFTTAVSVAVDAGASVLPYRSGDPTAQQFAAARSAEIGGLSPSAATSLEPGARVVIPSPNGSSLAAEAAAGSTALVLAGSLRNASATANSARITAGDGAIAVIAAGERWPSGQLRPCVEDLLGAGAVLAALDPSASVSALRSSPEASVARAAFLDARPLLHDTLRSSSSGRELITRGDAHDVAIAAQHDVSTTVAALVNDAFIAI